MGCRRRRDALASVPVRSRARARPCANAAPAAGYSPAKQKAEPVEVTYDGVPDDVNMDLGAVDAQPTKHI